MPVYSRYSTVPVPVPVHCHSQCITSPSAVQCSEYSARPAYLPYTYYCTCCVLHLLHLLHLPYLPYLLPTAPSSPSHAARATHSEQLSTPLHSTATANAPKATSSQRSSTVYRIAPGLHRGTDRGPCLVPPCRRGPVQSSLSFLSRAAMDRPASPHLFSCAGCPSHGTYVHRPLDALAPLHTLDQTLSPVLVPVAPFESCPWRRRCTRTRMASVIGPGRVCYTTPPTHRAHHTTPHPTSALHRDSPLADPCSQMGSARGKAHQPAPADLLRPHPHPVPSARRRQLLPLGAAYAVLRPSLRAARMRAEALQHSPPPA